MLSKVPYQLGPRTAFVFFLPAGCTEAQPWRGLGVTTAEREAAEDAEGGGGENPTQEQQHVRRLQVSVSWLFSRKVTGYSGENCRDRPLRNFQEGPHLHESVFNFAGAHLSPADQPSPEIRFLPYARAW